MNDIFIWFQKHPTAQWFLKTSVYVLIIVLAVLFARRFIRAILSTEGKNEKQQTIFPILKQVLYGVVYFFAFSLLLEVFGVSSTPIWTMASAMSVAIGFGAQEVLKDVFSGMLILLEGQYVVGDTVEINGDTGEVEQINLRTTILRDWINGAVHIISNGDIRTVTNLSKNYMIAIVDLPIPYEVELDSTLKLIKNLAANYPKNKDIYEAINVLGVRDFDLRNMIVRLSVKTKAGANWSVERDLRRYFKNELEKNDIYLPHMAIHVREDKRKKDESI